MLARSMTIACCVAFALVAAGCGSSSKSASADASPSAPAVKTTAMNTKCPFSGGKVNEAVTVSFGDQTVAFCCPGCKARFEKMTDADKTALLSKAK